MSLPKPDDPLPGALRAWRINPARNPGFRPAVAARIAAGGAPTVQYFRAHPAVAGLLIILFCGVGAWAGLSSARVRDRGYADGAALRYVQAHDARWMALR